MKRHSQSIIEILDKLSIVKSEWKDETATQVIQVMDKIPSGSPSQDDIKRILQEDFNSAIILFQLFLDKSKDEFTSLRKELFDGPSGRKQFERNPDSYVATLEHLLLREQIKKTTEKEYTWKDLLEERLKSGRGSAIKGQRRGRLVEDYVQEIVESVFSLSYNARVSFQGRLQESTAKSDFAIPSKENPQIIIEVKAYGATGSKQSDVIGDVQKIIQEKRPDSLFLLVTDGITWKARQNDLKKLLKYQNDGYIYRIYTMAMEAELTNDLRQMKQELEI